MHQTRRPFLILVLLLATLALTPAHGEDLSPDGVHRTTWLRGSDTGRAYTLLATGEPARYRFCGQGEVEVLSRAVLAPTERVARYLMELEIDGARPIREIAHRVRPSAGSTFEKGERAGQLRRTSIDLPRGCHTLTLSVRRSSASAIAVRLLWDGKAPTLRRWQTVASVRASETVVVGDSRSQYFSLPAGDRHEVTLEGPGWVRLMVRPVGPPGGKPYSLAVERNGSPYRRWQLDHQPSKEAWLPSRPDAGLGKASEVAFPIGPGRHRIAIVPAAGTEVLLRPQVAASTSVDTAAVEPSWSVRPRIAGYYDNNILRYSDKFIDRFDAGTDPRRFRVESLDDWVQRADLYVSRRYSGLGGQPARVGLDVEHRAYQRNSIKDWTRFSAWWEQRLRGRRDLRLSASRNTNFYVRHLRDSDLTGRGVTSDPFQAFEFERSEFRARFEHELGASLDVRYHAGLAVFRHSDAFREFDSDNLFAGLRLDHRLTRRLRLSYGLEYTDSAAEGFDEPGETLATSDDTDPSYRQGDLMLAARLTLPTQKRQVLFLQAEWGLRDYTTSKPLALAPLHNGREDDLLRLYGSWQVDLGERYRLTAFAQARTRSSSAPIELDIGVEKDYDQLETGLRLTAYFGD